jgi:ubiquinone/menaquinone biosynthesis C-methylase UbiE
MATYDASAVARLNKLYSAPQVVEQRQRLHALLGARPGEKGLDIGCGAGHLACELARDVAPNGRIFGIDSSADSVSASIARAQRDGVSITVHTAEATALPFDDAMSTSL